ncbi:MAG: hypothetical protein AB1486_13685 [Planctomycetota bacterium]
MQRARLSLLATLVGLVAVNAPSPSGVECIAQDEDVAGVQATEDHAGKDEHKRYFLISAAEEVKPPPGGFGLLVILPGGSGDESFGPFVKRIFKNALNPSYLAVQLVATKWSEDQKIVWPTAKNPVNGMKFTTEEFVKAVIEDVKKSHKLDPRRIYTLGWSSSGPVAYAVSLDKKSAVRGSYVSMSVFKPDFLPSLRTAKGHALCGGAAPK